MLNCPTSSRSRSVRGQSRARVVTCPREGDRGGGRRARNATAGTDLISPSNNHDLYSIEDLAELVDELKTANPDVRVSVAGRAEHRHDRGGNRQGRRHDHALSGFEGGTGRARPHALRHVGLPSGHRHPRRAPGPDGGRYAQPRGDLGRRRLPPRARHRQAPLPGRQPRGFGTLAMVRSGARSAAAASSTPVTSGSRLRSSRRRRPSSRD